MELEFVQLIVTSKHRDESSIVVIKASVDRKVLKDDDAVMDAISKAVVAWTNLSDEGVALFESVKGDVKLLDLESYDDDVELDQSLRTRGVYEFELEVIPAKKVSWRIEDSLTPRVKAVRTKKAPKDGGAEA